MEKTRSMNGLYIVIEEPNGTGSNSVSEGWQ
jgi:hypothetical protein